MPALRVYRVFISHAWHRSEHYECVVDWLDSAPNLVWENLSVPEHDPLTADNLDSEIRNQMRDADVFLILGGMYAAHSEWIDFELKWARIMARPIIGIRPRGNQVMPAAIQRQALEIVNWNSASVVSAIRRRAVPTG